MTTPDRTGMLCPIDKTPLTMTAREGVEIDYCPQCRGVWLDRGELDKLIERNARYEAGLAAGSAAPMAEPGYAPQGYRQQGYPQQQGYPPQPGYPPQGYPARRYDDDDDDEDRYPRRRRGFLGNLFDFD